MVVVVVVEVLVELIVVVAFTAIIFAVVEVVWVVAFTSLLGILDEGILDEVVCVAVKVIWATQVAFNVAAFTVE